MIGAGEARGVAGVGAAQAIAAVAADIEKGVHLAASVAHHQHRVLAHVGGQEIARARDLAVVAQKQPASGEDLAQLLLVNLRFDKDAPADQPALGIDETSEFHCHQTLLYSLNLVIPGLVPGIPFFRLNRDGRDKPGHDEQGDAKPETGMSVVLSTPKFGPAVGRHQLRPVPVEAAVV